MDSLDDTSVIVGAESSTFSRRLSEAQKRQDEQDDGEDTIAFSKNLLTEKKKTKTPKEKSKKRARNHDDVATEEDIVEDLILSSDEEDEDEDKNMESDEDDGSMPVEDDSDDDFVDPDSQWKKQKKEKSKKRNKRQPSKKALHPAAAAAAPDIFPPAAAMSSAANVMLAIHEKRTTPTDLYRPLRLYIASAYSEREAAAADDDLAAVRDLRADVEQPSLPDPSSLERRRDALLAYARALSLVEPRFPISPDRAHVHSLAFTWHDAFKTGKKASVASIHLEKAAVLFNLAAVYSQIALAADRATDVGIRTACGSFQSAAGAFAWMRESGVAAKAVAAGATTVDVTPECAAMLEKLMLAQAQECFFEKVIAGGKPPALCSKVARQVGIFYEEAYAALSAAPLSQHFDKTWVSHVQLKAAQFYADACYRCSLDLHEKEEIAQEIARLKIGISALADAKKVARGVAAPLLDSVNKLESNMKTNLERAMKENDRVYLMRVPDASSLGALPAASLVKPTSLAEVLDASKERLFSSLVPDGSMKALSKYTEMVDNIIRTQAEKLQQASEITRVRLKEMDLPDSILSLEGNITLPLDLKEDVEAVQISGGPAGLEAELQQLRDLSRVNQELLVQTEEMLQKEANEDAQFRTQFGSRWTRPQSSTLTKNIQDRLNLFASNLKTAGDSDSQIERGLKESYPLMSILDRRPIESALPSISRPIMSLDGNEDAIVGALKQSLRQLESLGAQRAGLEDMLKEMKRKDDILPKLMAGVGSHDDLFKKEISKYDPVCAEIADNIVAQEQLLLQIQAQNEQFAAVFNLEDYKVARERCYKQIAAAVAKYRDIKKNINEGLNFYVTLQEAIGKIKQQCSDFIMTRNIQCREMIEDVQKKLAAKQTCRGTLLRHQIRTVHHHHHRLTLPMRRAPMVFHLGVIQDPGTLSPSQDPLTHSHTRRMVRHRNSLRMVRHRNSLLMARPTLVTTNSRHTSNLPTMTMANKHILEDGAGSTTIHISPSRSRSRHILSHRTMPRGSIQGRGGRAGGSGAEDARHVFDELLRRGRGASIYGLYRALAHVARHSPAAAMSRYNRMARAGADEVTPNLYTYGILIRSCCRAGRLDLGFAALGNVIKKGFRVEAITFTPLLKGLCADKRTSDAMDIVLRRMTQLGCIPNVFSYTILLKGLCDENRSQEALELLHMMADDRGGGSPPDVVSYTTVIDGFFKEGDLDKAYSTYHEMLDRRILPNVVTYISIIAALCKAQAMDKAMEVLNTMVKNGVMPNCRTYNSVVHGYCSSAQPKEAIGFLKKMRSDGVEPNVVTYH
uniref:BRO1 domain-containing protein n=2 Tax=Oryza glumipatula TaxID=40148 RepID=A0A0E0BC69_9ORYZ